MYFEVVTGDIIREDECPTAVSSKFGWLLSGPVKVPHDHVNVNVSVSNLIIEGYAKPEKLENEIIATELKSFWDTESIGIHEGEEIESKFLGEVNHDGRRYEVGLPWKQSEPEPLSDNYSLALGRLNSLWNRLEKDSGVLNEYDNIINDQLNSGILEIVPKTEQTKAFTKNNTVHYLSHFGVVRKNNETTKLRIVFDGSAKSEREPEVVQLLNKQLFVNDFVGGAKTVQEGVNIYSTSKKMMQPGGFNLQKWKTSSPELREMIEKEENSLSKNET